MFTNQPSDFVATGAPRIVSSASQTSRVHKRGELEIRWIQMLLHFQCMLYLLGGELPTNRKWVITPVINGISRVNPLKKTGVN